MAERVISFFGRQEFSGSDMIEFEILSPVIDVQGFNTIVFETQVYASNPAVVSYAAVLYSSEDQTLAASSWSILATQSIVTSGGVGREKSAATNPGRFVRLKITVPAGAPGASPVATISSCGIARS